MSKFIRVVRDFIVAHPLSESHLWNVLPRPVYFEAVSNVKWKTQDLAEFRWQVDAFILGLRNDKV